MENLKSKSIKGFFWDLAGKFSLQGIGFIVSIFLARLLTPEEFGLVGMVMVIIPITQVFMNMGFGAALIQKKKISQNLYSSVFWLNIILGGILTLLLYFTADLIAQFYKREELSALVKVLSLTFIISSFGIVQTIHFTKVLNFKTQAIIAIIASLLSGCIGITLAFYNYGVWALVYQKLVAVFISVIAYWFFSKWRPKFYFSINDIKSIWGFSNKVFLDGIISTIYSKLDIIMIGKLFTASTLGYYTRAQSLDSMVNTFSSGSITRVFFPMISNIQNDKQQVVKIYKIATILVGFISIGLTGFLYVVADDLFIILFTKKWIYSAQLFKLMAIVGFTYPLSSIMVNLISGLGYSGKNLKLGLWKKSVGLLALFFGYKWGIEAFLYACILRNLIGLIMNMVYVSKVINLSILAQLKWVYKPILVALILVLGNELITSIENIYLSFIVKGGTFGFSYIILVYFSEKEISNIVKTQLNNFKQNARNRNR